jgi:unsaturated rhamnogalacturonyl hydrolase
MSSLSLQNGTTVNSWAIRMAGSALQNYPLSDWKWHYEHGLVVQAFSEVGSATGDARFSQFVRNWVDHFVTANGHIRTYRTAEYNLDQINPGKLLFPLYRQTGDPRYAQAIRLLESQLRRQPRTQSGGLWHKKIYPQQMWLDGLYMAQPFHAEYALTFDEPVIFDDVVHQFILMAEHARDPRTGLFYHAWDESRIQKWADPLTGCSPQFWGRGMGWYAMALVDVLDILPASHPGRLSLVEILQRASNALLHFQDPATGLWYQVIDRLDRPDNYRESSVSAMLVYVFAKAVRKGYLESDYLSAAGRAYRGLLENKIKVDASGILTLEGTCSVAGLGNAPYRDGSYEYYVGEKTSANDFKGVGPFILAALEMEASRREKTP